MTPTHVSLFKSLHEGPEPLVLNNIWDAASAAVLSSNGALALATSSASLAWSAGYSDGSLLPIADLLINVGRIRRVTDLPLSVDIEDGYADSPESVAALVSQLVEIGVAGINIEDGTQSPQLLVSKIAAIREQVGDRVFINARTDVCLRALVCEEQAAEECATRVRQYIDTGADCVFIPGTLNASLFSIVIRQTGATINAMIPSIDHDVSALSAAGVKRYSTGPSPYIRCLSSLVSQRDSLGFEDINRLFI